MLCLLQASDWGPWVGGDGVKTMHSKPDVLLSFDPTLKQRDPVIVESAETARYLRDMLAVERHDRLSALHNEHAMAAYAAHVHDTAPGMLE